MKPRSFFLILATGAIAIFLVGVGGLYWLVAQSPLNLLAGGVNIYPHGAIFVPKQAPVMVSLLVNPEKLSALHQLSVPISKRNRDRLEWNQLKTNLLANTGLDYQQDIKPWLGTEVTLAITSLDYDRNDDNGVQPGYLLATATQPQTSDFGWLFVAESTPEADGDLNEAISHLDNLAQQRGLDVSKFQVGDNQITTWTKLITASGASGRNSVTLNTDVKGAYSHTDKYVFLASSLEAIATALNQQNSWLENPKSPKIVKAPPVDSDGYVYINFADGKSMLEKQIPRIRVMELVEQSLFDHARAIAFSSKGTQDGTTRATILFNFDG